MKRLLIGLAALLFACADPGGPAPTDDGAAAASSRTVAQTGTLVVHYPTGWGHSISVRGASAGLDWKKGRGARWTADDAWQLEVPLDSPVELKPLYDDVTWSKGPNYLLRPGQTLHIWPRFFHDKGRLERIKDFRSLHVDQPRDIVVYLPPGYDENWHARYPVVYMHDGQNLYDDASSFGGVSWDVTGAMDRGTGDGSVREAIIVGIDNTKDRMWEYTPTDGGYDGGGADAYLAFIAEELKPAIDGDYRTLPGPADTAIIGSSLGGLVSVYAGLTRNDVFGLVGGLSPSTWWDGTWIIAQVRSSKQLPLRVYLDSGDSGTAQDDKQNTAKLAQAFRDRTVELRYLVQPGASHNEYWWRQRLPGALAFLLGAR